MASTDAQKRASIKWNKANVRNFTVGFNVETESDLLTYLESKKNKTAYIKELIRKDMAHNQN